MLSFMTAIFALLRKDFTNRVSYYQMILGTLLVVIYDIILILVRFIDFDKSIGFPAMALVGNLGNYYIV